MLRRDTKRHGLEVFSIMAKTVLLSNTVSAHQLPLAIEIIKRVRYFNFRYVYDGSWRQDAAQEIHLDADWVVNDLNICEECKTLLVGGLRPIDLIERRWGKGLVTYYQSERWFKPWHGLPGCMRMLVPSYRKMVKRFVRWANSDPNAKVLAIGPWAKKDFLKMGVRANKIIPWGYFVAPSTSQTPRISRTSQMSRTLRVLWVGRDLAWKRVKDIEKAVELVNNRFRVGGLEFRIEFTKLTGVTPEEVREAMREHDLYVLASNAEEGWGAALNEALEEGMNAVGTFEAGASAAMLPCERLYHAGDVKALAKLIEQECRGELPPCTIGEWTAAKAAERLLAL